MNWNQFVEDYQERIFSYCYQFLGNFAEAEDVTQEVFTKCFVSYREQEVSKSLVYRIARNACVDQRRLTRRIVNLLNSREEKNLSTPQDELALSLRRLIAALPTQQKEVFIMRHWHGFSTEEVATFLSVSQSTVKTQLSRAVQKLKAELDSDGQ